MRQNRDSSAGDLAEAERDGRDSSSAPTAEDRKGQGGGQEVVLTVRLTVRRVLSRGEVTKAVEGLQSSQWTIRDVAEAMNEREYRVRAAVSWLCHHGRAAVVGYVVKTSSVGRPYDVALYELRTEKSPADITGLYRAFGLKG